MNVEGVMLQIQEFHKTLTVINVGLDTVGHQNAHHIFSAVSRHGQGSHHAGVLAAGDADDSGLAAAGFHLLPHPLNETGQLFFCVEFHTVHAPFLPHCKGERSHLQGDSAVRKDVAAEMSLFDFLLSLLHGVNGRQNAARFQIPNGVGQSIKEMEIEFFVAGHQITPA